MKYLKLFEDFLSKDDVMDWLHKNGILKSKDHLNPVELIEFFTIKNPDLIKETALANCHAVGLNSFILNQSPKIRLFICDDNSELHSKFDPRNPIIPIHPHKYDDYFFQISGKLVHHLYKKDINGIQFNKYNFIRLNSKDTKIQNLGVDYLKYVGEFSNINKLRSKALHTASVIGKCSWIIIETKKDESFSEVLHHQDLQKRPELYRKIENPIRFIESFISSVKLNEEFNNGTSLGNTPNNLPNEVRNVSQIADRLGVDGSGITLSHIISYLNKQQFKCQKEGDDEISFNIDNYYIQVIRNIGKKNKFEYFVLVNDNPIECSYEIGERIFNLLSGSPYKNNVRGMLGQL